MRPRTSRAARATLMTSALLVGTLILPGTADVPDHSRAPLASAQETASQKYGWAPALFDFAWEYGESLVAPPGRGTKRKGGWEDVSTGSGRAARHNGGMMLESKYGTTSPGDAGPGDHGTTTLTLQGNPQTYGRWELRGRTWAWNDPGQSYKVRYALVPENDPYCSARSITIAEFSPGQSSYAFGAFTPDQQRAWRGTKSGIRQGKETSHSYAVEVGKDHITWFVDARPVGILKTKDAIPKVPLTLQLSLIGDDMNEMRHTYVIQDWVRGFPLGKGRQVRSGAGSLTAGNHNENC